MENQQEEGKQEVAEVVVTTVESDENESEDRPQKKARVSTDAAVPQPTTLAKPDEPHCLVCMETASEDTTLLKHQCSQCNPDAWQVCDSCNSALLSRTCPVCRGEYAPIIMYAMPGHPLNKLADPTLTADQRAELLYKFGVVRQLVSKVNMAVYTPSTQKMHFTLPKHMTENITEQDDEEDVSLVIVSLPFDAQRFPSPDTFNFTNSIWDEIEDTIETGEVQAGAEVGLPQATTWLLGHTREAGHVLFSMVSPAEWSQLLNVEAPDVRDAVQKMLTEILKNVNLPPAVQGAGAEKEEGKPSAGEGV